MGLETANTSSELVATWPLPNDPVSRGDDHLRLLKRVIQNDMSFLFGRVHKWSFEQGATLFEGEMLYYEQDKTYYEWQGSFPTSGLVVPSGSSPATTGGIALGAWQPVAVGAGGGRSAPIVAATAPANVPADQLWYCTQDGKLYIYYSDGDSLQWVEACPQQASADLAETQFYELARRSYAEAGYNLVGTFETGAIIANANDIVLHKATGIAYTGPVGVVEAGTNPTAVGSGYAPRSGVLLRSDLSEMDGAGVIGVCPDISTLRTIEPINQGQRIFLRGYHADTPGYGGADFWYDETDTTSSDDGGLTIVTTGGKRWKRRIDKVSVFDFGAKPSSTYDSRPAFVAASAAAHARGIGEVHVEFNCAVSQFTHPKGIVFVGQGRQTYGEFANDTSTDITLLAGAGQWGWLIPQYNTLGGLRNITLVGDWTNHGIKSNLQTSREFELSNVSIRNVMHGMNTIDCFFSGFGNVTITCRGIGFNNSGGGTTLDLSRFIVQGDKENSIRCTDCYKFHQTDYPSNPLSSSMLRVAAGQYCERVFNIADSTRLIIDCANVEDYSECAFLIHDTYKTKLGIRNPGVLGASGVPIFKFAGTIAAQTEVDIGLISASDNVDVTPTAIFMQDGSGLAANGRVYINYELYDKVISQIGTLCRTMLVVRKEYRHTAGDAIWLNGASTYQVTFTELEQLWQATMAYAKASLRLQKMSGSTFGNGLTFTVNSSATSGGAPNFTIVSVRSSATAAMNKVDITGTHNIVADFANGYLTITPVSTTQSIVIRAS